MFHVAAQSKIPDGLDMVRSISVNQSADEVTTATVVLLIDMDRG